VSSTNATSVTLDCPGGGCSLSSSGTGQPTHVQRRAVVQDHGLHDGLPDHVQRRAHVRVELHAAQRRLLGRRRRREHDPDHAGHALAEREHAERAERAGCPRRRLRRATRPRATLGA
jgi:hypothetical protein